MLEANYLTMLLKPNYEKAVNTAQDVIDRNLTVIWIPGMEDTKEIQMNFPPGTTRRIAELANVPKVRLCYIEKFLF